MKRGYFMEILQLPLTKHYSLITSHGFSTFMICDPHNFLIQDIPLAHVLHILTNDQTDRATIDATNSFLDRFKFNAIKFFGTPLLHSFTFNEALKQYEKPLARMIALHNETNKKEILEALRKLDPRFADQEINIRKASLAWLQE
jgi:hypothetical protein